MQIEHADASIHLSMHHPNVWRELREHKEEIFPRRIVIRPRPKPQRKASNDAVAPTTLAKPIPYGRFARRRSSSVAGIDGSLAFELFGGRGIRVFLGLIFLVTISLLIDNIGKDVYAAPLEFLAADHSSRESPRSPRTF